MRIVVTGGSGRIGSATAAALREAGHEVLTLDQRPPANLEAPHRVIDLRNRDAVRQAIEGYEAICHIGEIPGIYNNDPQGTFQANVTIGTGVMQSAITVGMRKIIYTSTCQVYGCWGIEHALQIPADYLPLDEEHPLRPCNAYAASKFSNEHYARMLSMRHGVPVAAFRFPAVLSDPNSKHLGGFKPSDGSRKVRGPGDGFNTWLHFTDAASAYVRAIEADWVGFEAFHFVADDIRGRTPTRQVVAEQAPKLTYSCAGDDFASPVTTTKARRMLNWRPTMTRNRVESSAA
jgi:nucleoside-diphosphate-sugar epimerase